MGKTEFQRGRNSMRDSILCIVYGLQAEIEPNTDEYKAYEKMVDTIKNRYGNLLSENEKVA